LAVDVGVPGAAGTPANGSALIYVDPTTRALSVRDGLTNYTRSQISNFSVAAQTPAATVRTYLVGSALAVPQHGLQIGTTLSWQISMTKTAAGSASSTFDICFGAAGTTADTARVTFTKPAGTAAVDEGTVTITAVVRSIGTAGVVVGQFSMTHANASTGHLTTGSASVNTISAGFDLTVPNLIVGVCLTSGAADAVSVQLVTAQAVNL
jgi:hypothetical protein